MYRLQNGSEESGSVAIKVMPLLDPVDLEGGTEEDDKEVKHFPEPIELSNLLQEAKVLRELSGLSADRRYAIPSGITGFNVMKRYILM